VGAVPTTSLISTKKYLYEIPSDCVLWDLQSIECRLLIVLYYNIVTASEHMPVCAWTGISTSKCVQKSCAFRVSPRRSVAVAKKLTANEF